MPRTRTLSPANANANVLDALKAPKAPKARKAPATPAKAAAPHKGAPTKPVLRFRVRVTAGDAIALGPGKVALLEAIASTGSITAAAQSIGMSYRRAWLLLDELNRTLRKPAVDSAKGGQTGGGSTLTASGRQVIELYRRIEVRATQACAAEIAQLLKLVVR